MRTMTLAGFMALIIGCAILPASLALAQDKEWQVIYRNLGIPGELYWYKLMGNAMLLKANWLASRLDLPIHLPIQPWQAYVGFDGPAGCILHKYPSWIPDTIYGNDIYNTNIPRLKRVLALKFCLDGVIWNAGGFTFRFMDGQCWYIARNNPSGSDRYVDRFAEAMIAPHVHPPPSKTAEIYQIATNWLASIDVNLDMLEKSRLPHPVRQEQYQPPGARSPQPIYYVAWGTNYYGADWDYHFFHTNEWHPSVLVEIGPGNALLQLYVGDLTYYRNPPTLLNSREVWRTIRTPDPPLKQLRNPDFMAQFFRTLTYYTNYPDYDYCSRYLTNSLPWRRVHHNWNGLTPRYVGVELNIEKQEQIGIIPYKPGDDPVFDTNQP